MTPPPRAPVRLAAALAVLLAAAAARGDDYRLEPEEIAPGVFVFWGAQEGYLAENGGNVANAGFIVGEREALAIDAGPTRRYAEQAIAAIRRVTDKPLRTVVVTHHHPDHAFGIGPFKRANARVLMHRAGWELLERDGPALLLFMQTLLADRWTSGTEVTKPSGWLRREKVFDLGGRSVRAAPLAGGHTPGDVIVFDEATKTLFAGDLVFRERAPTVPHADIPTWLAHLDTLAGMDWRRLVPGHGPLVVDPAQLATMRDYLVYLREFARKSADEGRMLAETLEAEIPERFHGLAGLEAEFARSMGTLFRKFEGEQFDASLAVN